MTKPVTAGRGSRRLRARLRGARVWLNGEDVTARAYFADPGGGAVRLYRVDEAGRLVVRAGAIVREERHGRVRVGRHPEAAS